MAYSQDKIMKLLADECRNGNELLAAMNCNRKGEIFYRVPYSWFMRQLIIFNAA